MANDSLNPRGIENRGTENRSLSPQGPRIPYHNPIDIIVTVLKWFLPHIKWVIRVDTPPNEPGGWKVATVRGIFSYLTKLGSARNIICDLAVGVPIVNYKGPVSNQFATNTTLDCMNYAGRIISEGLKGSDPLFVDEAAVCTEFKSILQREIQILIPGAIVTRVGNQ